MSHIVETSEEDSWLATASYIGELIDAGQEDGSKLIETPGSRFADQCKGAYEAENYAELLEHFAANIDVLYSKASNEQDLEGCANIICHLVPRIPAPSTLAGATRLASALSATPTSRPDRRLQALINLYNVVWEPQAKFTILLEALAFSKVSGLADVMLGIIRTQADSWSSDLALSPVDGRRLYAACADALRGCTRKPKTAAKEAHRLLCKYLTTLEGAVPKEVAKDAGSLQVAAQVVTDFIRSSDLFHFDLAENPAVVALSSSTVDGSHPLLHHLLTIYLTGTVADFKSFASSNAAFFSSLGLDVVGAGGKMRLLALLGIANGVPELSFLEIAAVLDVPAEEVEATVVQAIGKKLVEARIDQLREVVVVGKCTPRSFGPSQWRELQGQLRAWRESVTQVLELGREEKDVLPRGIAELSVSA